MKTKQPPEPIEITCQQCGVTKLYVEYPIIENNKRAEICKQCSEIAAALEKHQPKIEDNSTIICTCKNCIDLKYINQVRDSVTFLIIRLQLGSINIPSSYEHTYWFLFF
jgi:RNase P subunit RPR2